MQWNEMQWNASDCIGMQWHAMKRNAINQNGMQWNAMDLWSAVEGDGMHQHAMQCNAVESIGMQLHATECYGMPWNAKQIECNEMQLNERFVMHFRQIPAMFHSADHKYVPDWMLQSLVADLVVVA